VNKKLVEIDNDSIDKIIVLIYAHHSNLLNSLPKPDYIAGIKFKNSHNAMAKNLLNFYNQTKKLYEFSKLDWDKCLKLFQSPLDFQMRLRSNKTDYIYDFLHMSVLYSCLLQADRGSFEDWITPVFDIDICTEELVKSQSVLSELRTKFQKEVQNNHDQNLDICILNAPTGIGKTKVFLDLIQKYKESTKNIERIFYFSPLLALTEDFEKKLEVTIKEKKEDILIYNHLFSGSLVEKNLKESGTVSKQQWMFPYESFNMKFIITTTQRFLVTLYSNSSSDKLKLASLKNSILIIDEIQTIPKFLLYNLVNLLKELAKKMKLKIILVSATIPYELNSIPKIKISKDLIQNYLINTRKHITFREQLSITNITNKNILIMSNTRRKTVNIFKNISSFIKQDIYIDPDNDENIFYMSSGIRKKDRIKIIDYIIKINSKNKIENNNDEKINHFLLVSTQVVEAGVDISFSEIYREVAPLDNIIQVMGRLNREGTDSNAILSIFQSDDDHRPYSEVEYSESLPILRAVKTSEELYENLSKYYETVNIKNKLNESKAQKLQNYMVDLDFLNVWKFVNDNVMPDDGDSIFVPENKEQWMEIKNEFISSEKLNKNVYRKFALLTASIPKSVSIKMIKNFCDEELLKHDILLPKLELLNEIYDKKIGLDKWLITE
jgi:CRISPR-associated endonuclease/helicase Cas3